MQGLYGPEGSLILAEQPEIHLNPRLQSGLADLFSSFVQQGRRVLVETHSEHLLLRLRRLVAEGQLKSSDLALYYIERSGNTSTVRNVPVQSNGHIQSEDWPVGFFEDSLREAFDLAAAQTRSKSA